jgi:hypothetical protein
LKDVKNLLKEVLISAFHTVVAIVVFILVVNMVREISSYVQLMAEGKDVHMRIVPKPQLVNTLFVHLMEVVEDAKNQDVQKRHNRILKTVSVTEVANDVPLKAVRKLLVEKLTFVLIIILKNKINLI